MADKSPSVSSLPWLWVMEALASFEQVDLSLLKDLMIEVPEASDNLGTNAKEIINLRCLESLFGPSKGIADDVPSVVHSKIGFDPSESCEDVLQRILRQVPASKLKIGGPELLKWDIHPFIVHKRACLPKCALLELKDKILEGTHPSAASLREKSGLKFGSQFGLRSPMGDGDSDTLAPRVEEISVNGQVEAAKGDLISPTAEKNRFSPEEIPNRILPHKRGQNDSAAKNLAGQLNENLHNVNDGADFYLNAKRHKMGGFCPSTSLEPNPVSLDRNKLFEDTSRPSTSVSSLARESRPGDLEGSMIFEADRDENVCSKRYEQSTYVDCEEAEHNQNQIPSCSNKMPHNMSEYESHHDISVGERKDDDVHLLEPNKSSVAPSDGNQQKTYVDEAKDDGDHRPQSKASNVKLPDESRHNIFVDTEHFCEQEMLSDGTEYHDEEDGIAMEKQNFLSSQCTFSQDSLATAGWTEQNLCTKCNKDGHLLVCSSSSCPLVVHENCLGSPASFDNRGNFCCPFCAYSRAVSVYLESKKKASMAKKDLAAFLNVGIRHEPQKPKKSQRKKQYQKLNGDANLVEIHENRHVREKRNTRANSGGVHVNQISNQKITRGIEKQKAESSAPCVNDNVLLREVEATAIGRTLGASAEDKQDTEEIVKECQSTRMLDEQQNKHQAKDKCDGAQDQGDPKLGVEQESLLQQMCDPPEGPAPALDADEGTSGDENDKPSGCNYHIRFRKQQHQYTYPAIPLLRRKKRPWTSEEEEILKEGVKKFSNDRNVQWKKILEFGGTVFDKGRTTIDLKDKWRNICKGSPK